MSKPASENVWTVVDVVDTRDRDPETNEIIVGSGYDAPCDCCGRAILIHVTVRRGDERKVVGVACAKKMGGAVAKSVKAMVARMPCPLVDGLMERGLVRGDALNLVGHARAWEREGKRWDLLASLYSVDIDRHTPEARANELRALVERLRAGNRARPKGAEREAAIDWLMKEVNA